MKNIFANLFYMDFILNINNTVEANGKGFDISSVYLLTTILSLILLFGYYIFVKNKNKWLYLMFSAVPVVNFGYFIISVSKNLGMALWGNRISYLGSVFLPLSMLFVIIDLCGINYRKQFPYILLGTSGIMFLITATQGFLDIYYKDVALEVISGASVLNKTYGILHPLYMIYLGVYYAAMIWILCSVSRKKKSPGNKNILIPFVAVTVNLFVWLLEQLVDVDFEFLSVSYIISELFLLSVFLMIEEQEKLKESVLSKIKEQTAVSDTSVVKTTDVTIKIENEIENEALNHFRSQLNSLTPTEKIIYGLYVSGKSTKEVLYELNITENTLKYHNRNIYGKLGVPSRKVLIETARQIENTDK